MRLAEAPSRKASKTRRTTAASASLIRRSPRFSSEPITYTGDTSPRQLLDQLRASEERAESDEDQETLAKPRDSGLGGEPEKLTDEKGPISDFEWSPDGIDAMVRFARREHIRLVILGGSALAAADR